VHGLARKVGGWGVRIWEDCSEESAKNRLTLSVQMTGRALWPDFIPCVPDAPGEDRAALKSEPTGAIPAPHHRPPMTFSRASSVGRAA
jgi:hypothetical protein